MLKYLCMGLFVISLTFLFLYLQERSVNSMQQEQLLVFKDSITEVNSKISRLKYRVLVIPYRSRLELGEAYKALVIPALIDTVEHGKVVVFGENINGEEEELTFSKYFGAFEYSCTPTHRGDHRWKGEVKISSLNNQVHKFVFIEKYSVK